jgi:hypothetical protein
MLCGNTAPARYSTSWCQSRKGELHTQSIAINLQDLAHIIIASHFVDVSRFCFVENAEVAIFFAAGWRTRGATGAVPCSLVYGAHGTTLSTLL